MLCSCTSFQYIPYAHVWVYLPTCTYILSLRDRNRTACSAEAVRGGGMNARSFNYSCGEGVLDCVFNPNTSPHIDRPPWTVNMHVSTYTDIHLHTHAHTCVFVCVYVYICIVTYIYNFYLIIYSYTIIYIYIYMYIFTCIYKSGQGRGVGLYTASHGTISEWVVGWYVSESVVGGYMCIYCDCLGTYEEQISDGDRDAEASKNSAVFDFCQVWVVY